MKLYLSNPPSHATAGHHGPGRKLAIMARPPFWVTSKVTVGCVPSLCPELAAFDAHHAGTLSTEAYFGHYLHALGQRVDSLGPNRLRTANQSCFYGSGNRNPRPMIEAPFVGDGDTLLCTCPRRDSKRRTHECHRDLAAMVLTWAGWSVVLDGELYRLSDGDLSDLHRLGVA